MRRAVAMWSRLFPKSTPVTAHAHPAPLPNQPSEGVTLPCESAVSDVEDATLTCESGVASAEDDKKQAALATTRAALLTTDVTLLNTRISSFPIIFR